MPKEEDTQRKKKVNWISDTFQSMPQKNTCLNIKKLNTFSKWKSAKKEGKKKKTITKYYQTTATTNSSLQVQPKDRSANLKVATTTTSTTKVGTHWEYFNHSFTNMLQMLVDHLYLFPPPPLSQRNVPPN